MGQDLVEIISQSKDALPKVKERLAGGTPVDINAYHAGETPLLAAIRTKQALVVAFLLKSKANVNLPSGKYPNDPPLSAAAGVGSVEIMELLRAWPDLKKDATNKQGYTALHKAAVMGHKDAVRWLVLQGFDLAALSNLRATPLELATQYRQAAVVKEIKALNAEFEQEKRAFFLFLAGLYMENGMRADPDLSKIEINSAIQHVRAIASFVGINFVDQSNPPTVSAAAEAVVVPSEFPAELRLAANVLRQAKRLVTFPTKPDQKAIVGKKEVILPAVSSAPAPPPGISSLDDDDAAAMLS